MASTLYSNFVLESKLTDLLNTKLATRNFMTVDTSLAQNAGMIKTVNTYTYHGLVEAVDMTNATVNRGHISFSPTNYTALTYQQVFDYYDEEFAADPMVLDMGMAGATTIMVNDLNSKYFTELAKATLYTNYATNGAITYDNIVDAISLMDLEDESGVFIIIPPDQKAALRKDSDFTAARQGEIVFNGQIGSVAGLPVVVSKLCPTGVGYVADKSAVTLFVKKESEVEQVRDAEHRKNTVVLRKVGIVALTDATKVVKIQEG